MAENHQHYRFIGGGLLQTQRDQKRFDQKSRPTIATSAFTCFAASASRENQTHGLNILFVFIMDLVQASLKEAAVGGIFMIWTDFTIEAFKFSWHIISTSPKKILTKLSQKSVVKNARDFSMVN